MCCFYVLHFELPVRIIQFDHTVSKKKCHTEKRHVFLQSSMPVPVCTVVRQFSASRMIHSFWHAMTL